MNRLAPLVVVWLAVFSAQAQATTDTLSATQDEPRAFGYFVGDRVVRLIDIQAPAPLRLDEESLPVAGRQGQALELRRVSWQRNAAAGGTHYALTLEYQVFLAPREVRTLEMAPLKLRFAGAPRVQELRIEAWPVTVAPLVPVEASPRHGLGEFRPDAAPPLIDTRPALWRLAGCAVLAALLLVYLAHVYLALPWWSRRQRPFAIAWPQVRGLSATSSPEQMRAAMQALHQALNHSAGRVLFDHGVAAFIALQPRFAPLESELRGFFRLSHDTFFAAGSEAAADPTALVTLCRRCRDIERGAA